MDLSLYFGSLEFIGCKTEDEHQEGGDRGVGFQKRKKETDTPLWSIALLLSWV